MTLELEGQPGFDAGAIPIVIGQNSPPGSYAIAKPIGERAAGNVGVISLARTGTQALDRDDGPAHRGSAGSGRLRFRPRPQREPDG
jgi:hypothetical protein